MAEDKIMANENNKIPCGGFYLGDGLAMDGNTLKSSGGEAGTDQLESERYHGEGLYQESSRRIRGRL